MAQQQEHASADQRLGAVARGVQPARVAQLHQQNGGGDDLGVLHWVVGEARPAGLSSDPFLSALVPRPTAWVSVHGAGRTGDEPLVCLLDGYNASSDRPPTIMCAATALPALHLAQLQKTGLCCLSVATPREFPSLDILAKARAGGELGSATFAALELKPAPRADGRPPAVASSPCQMDCRLLEVVELGGGPATHSCGATRDAGQAMVLLLVQDFTIDGSVLVRQPTADGVFHCLSLCVRSSAFSCASTMLPLPFFVRSLPFLDHSLPVRVRSLHLIACSGQDAAALPKSNPDVRQIAAKLEAALVQPLGSLGDGRYSHVTEVYHMLRPQQAEPGGEWTSDTFRRADSAADVGPGGSGDFETVTYCYEQEEAWRAYRRCC